MEPWDDEAGFSGGVKELAVPPLRTCASVWPSGTITSAITTNQSRKTLRSPNNPGQYRHACQPPAAAKSGGAARFGSRRCIVVPPRDYDPFDAELRVAEVP